MRTGTKKRIHSIKFIKCWAFFLTLFVSGDFAPPISFRPAEGAVLMREGRRIRDFTMLIVRYNIINGIEDSGPKPRLGPRRVGPSNSGLNQTVVSN